MLLIMRGLILLELIKMKILKFLLYMIVALIGWLICIIAFTMPTVAVTGAAIVIVPLYAIWRMFDEK